MADNELDFEEKPYTWIDHLHFKLAQSGYDDGLPLPQWAPAAATVDSGPERFQAERINSPAAQQAPNQADGQSPQQMPDAPSVQPGPSAGNAPVPEHLKWVNDPKLLSNYLDKFNKQNPLHPGNAPKPVADVFGSMKAPAENYSPPTGANNDAAKYWFNYMGYPDQYALNKVSKESGGDPHAYATRSDAAGLGQVTPETAREVGFNFYKENPRYSDSKDSKVPKQILDEDAWRASMADPNFGSLLGSMVSRKYYNMAKGDPFRAEAGYRNGFGKLLEKERAGEPWPNPGYVTKMFPGQWNGQ